MIRKNKREKNQKDENQRFFQPNFFSKNRKGELTTQQIVLLIILITSFVVVLFFLFRLDLGKESKREICHNSVIMKGNSVLPGESVSLKCNREYVCITEDGTCEGLTNPEKFKVGSVEEIYQVLADKMADCWWMFGEGKIDYIGESELVSQNYCSICSQILFDDSLKNLEEVEDKISKDELYSYLSEQDYREGETYKEYIFGDLNLEEFKQELSNEANSGISFGTIDIGKQYYVVMGINSDSTKFSWIIHGTLIGGIAVVGLATAGIGSAGFLAVLAGEVAGGSLGAATFGIADLLEPEIIAITLEGEGVSNTFMAPTIQEINPDKFDELNCKEVITYA